jgi:3-oxoacyl-[acyl-carrier-protein] synthase-3
MKARASIRSLAISVPGTVRTNDWFRQNYPAQVAAAEDRSLAKLWKAGAPSDPFSIEMAPYLEDPFRGTIERRVLAPGEKALHLEHDAAQKALAAAGMAPNDVDLMIVTSFLPDQIGPGNAVFLARELGFKKPAFNLESACASSVVALHTASGLVSAGMYRNVLVVSSCTYSRYADPVDSLSWFMGDAAGAFVVGPSRGDDGLLGMHTIPTPETCNTFYFDRGDGDVPVMRCTPETGRILQATGETHLRTCCEGAARDAGVALSDIDFFVFNTPTAWFDRFAARALGVDPSRTISTYTRYANVGAALMPANLHAAALEGKVKRGDRVLVYAVGSVSSASAAVVRWGDVAVHSRPTLASMVS